jgi:nucleoporin NUP42
VLTLDFSLETMAKDFDVKADKPSWPLSSYGPAKNEQNLLPPLDESPDELRFKAITAIRNGIINEYVRRSRYIRSSDFFII